MWEASFPHNANFALYLEAEFYIPLIVRRLQIQQQMDARHLISLPPPLPAQKSRKTTTAIDA
jgi:hypothetical protein